MCREVRRIFNESQGNCRSNREGAAELRQGRCNSLEELERRDTYPPSNLNPEEAQTARYPCFNDHIKVVNARRIQICPPKPRYDREPSGNARRDMGIISYYEVAFLLASRGGPEEDWQYR